jgi:hypothetical protein
MKTAVKHAPLDRHELRTMSPLQQARLGIEVLEGPRLQLRCLTCGQTWYPDLTAAGLIEPVGLICPRKCFFSSQAE